MQVTEEEIIGWRIEELLTSLKQLEAIPELARYVIDPKAGKPYPVQPYPALDTAPPHPRFQEPYIAFYDFYFPDTNFQISSVEHLLRTGWGETVKDGKIFAALKKHGYEVTILEKPVVGEQPKSYYVGHIRIKQGLLPF